VTETLLNHFQRFPRLPHMVPSGVSQPMECESAVELGLLEGGPVHTSTEVVGSNRSTIGGLKHVIVGFPSPSALKVVRQDAHDKVWQGDRSD
jgi:hypothetical protein